MTNRLAGATSPYLLQHAENPVDWWEWGTGPNRPSDAARVPVLNADLNAGSECREPRRALATGT